MFMGKGKMFTDKIKKNILDSSLNRKIMLIVLCNILLISVFAILAFMLYLRTSNRLIYNSTADNLSYSASNMTSHINIIETLSATLIANDTLQETLSDLKDSGEAMDSASYTTMCTTMESYLQQYRKNHISYMMLTGNGFAAKTYIPISQRLPDEVIRDLEDIAGGYSGRPVWVTKYAQSHGLFLVRQVRRISNARLDPLAYLIINIDMERLLNDCCHFSNQYGQASYILANGSSLLQSSLPLTEKDSERLFSGTREPYMTINISGSKYFVVKNRITETGWDFYCLVPYGQIYSSLVIIHIMFFVTLFCSVLGSIVLSRHLIHLLTVHIDNLMVKIKSFADKEGSFTPSSFPFQYEGRKDEFSVLHQQFDQMAMRIQQLIHVNYKNEILRKDAQLKALTAQINPHFLYNTLESINWRAKASGEKDISRMVESLGYLLRATLSDPNEMVSLKRELDFVTCYLTIQQTRFEEQLQYTLEAEPDLLEFRLPKLIIQPLVENAVRHAMEELTDVCTITIRAYRDGDNAYIEVANNGSVFPDNLLEKLVDGSVQAEGFGIGLINIDQRLRLTYGKEYGLSLFNRDGLAIAQIKIKPGEWNHVTTDNC